MNTERHRALLPGASHSTNTTPLELGMLLRSSWRWSCCTALTLLVTSCQLIKCIHTQHMQAKGQFLHKPLSLQGFHMQGFTATDTAAGNY